MTETTEKRQVKVHKDNPTVWSCDISKIDFEQLERLIRDVFNYSEKPPQVLRINNTFFTSGDLGNWLIMRQGFHRIQWVR